MTLLPLVLGLIIFIGGHYVTRIGGLREKVIASVGIHTYRGLYSLVAVMGLALIVHGFAVYRANGYIPVWTPPAFMSHLVILFVLIAFTLLAATCLPGRIKKAARHPMLASVKVWAFAHLLVNGDLGSIILFGSFLAWAVAARIAAKKREALAPPAPIAVKPANDLIALGIGVAATLLFIYGAHSWLIGVPILPAVG